MIIDFEIGKPIGTLTDCYELYVESMSGDGDAYNRETFFSNGSMGDYFFDRIKLALAAFALTAKSSKLQDGDFSELKAFADELEIDWEMSDFFYDTFGRDSTCEDYYACPEEMQLFYYDDKGTKHKVNIIVNDKSYEKIYRYTGFEKFW